MMDHADFKIAWICALPVEMAAAQAMLDEVYPDLPRKAQDNNTYKYGRIGKHNIVIACQPAGVVGLVSAAEVASSVRRSFADFKMGLMVGIGGGVPDPEGIDIRLGDVVVSKPTATFGGVVQYDMGKTIHDGQFSRTGLLNRPPDALLTASAVLEAKHMTEGSLVPQYLSEMTRKFPRMLSLFSYQGYQHDKLFEATYEHEGTLSNCANCDAARLIPRPERPDTNPIVHYGTIASGNEVMRHGRTRDRVAADLDALCFEMEAAGLMNSFPCLVIRGICDYADSHKNNKWQHYAAAAAAAFAKELLYTIPNEQIVLAPNESQAMTPSLPHHSAVTYFGAASQVSRNIVAPARSPQKRKTYFKTPYRASKNFTGREDYLKRMEIALFSDDATCIAIYGLRGAGKTQIAIKFAEMHRSEYKAVFFVNASSDEDILSDYDKLHQLLELETTKETDNATQVLRWFADDSNCPWLVVFDNADALESTNISGFLPRGAGHVIITTLDHRVQDGDLVDEAIQLHMMSADESKRLLITRAGMNSLPDSETTSVDEVAKELGYHPLALDSAAAQVHHQKLSFGTYLSTFREKQENSRQLLRYRPRMSSYDKAIFDVLDINFDVLMEESSPAYSLLTLFAHLDGAAIQFDLLQRAAESQWRVGENGELFEQSPEKGCVDPSILKLIEDRISFHAAIERLMSLSLVYQGDSSSNSSSEVAMHPLVQIHVQSRLTPSEREHGTICALNLVAQAFPMAHRLEEFARVQPFTRSSFDEYRQLKYTYLPHARACCQNLERLFQFRQTLGAEEQMIVQLRLGVAGGPRMLEHVVYFFSEASMVKLLHYGIHMSRSNWCSRFLNMIDNLLKEEDDEYARILQAQNLFAFSREGGGYKRSSRMAMKFLQEHYPVFMNQTTSTIPISTVPLLNAELCHLLVGLAENMAENAVDVVTEARFDEIHKLLSLVRAVDPDAPSTAERIVLQHRARISGKVLKDQGKWEDALNALQAYCKNCVPGLMDEGWATADCALCLLELHRNDEAETVIKKLLTARWKDSKFLSDRPFADNENDHILLQIHLAECHLRQGNLSLSESEFDQMLSSMLDVEDPPFDHQLRIFTIYCGLARILHLRSEWARSKGCWERAVAYGETVSPRHFYIRVAMLSLADAMYEHGDSDAALTLKNSAEESGAFNKENRIYYMAGIGTYWLDEMLTKWNARIQ